MLLLYWFLAIMAVICVVASLLPFVPLPYGVFRVFEFPRVQTATLAGATAVAIVVFYTLEGWTWVWFGLSVLAVAIQFSFIARFTPIWARRSLRYDPAKHGEGSHVSLLISNVKLSNRDYSQAMALLRDRDPDIAIFLEVDQTWCDALEPGLEGLPHRLAYPQDNGYGMLLASRFELSDTDIRFLLNEEVPSFHTEVVHPSGERFRLIALHPEPPIASHDTIGRDAEIALVAKIVREEIDGPVLVTGDLNDVAWSPSTRRFLRLSQLVDPREGRGQYNSFDARYFFLRWPLDHIFHSPEFKLVSMKRLRKIGSDHFPMGYTFALTSDDTSKRETDEAEAQDLEEARDLVAVERQRERRPVGVDWEDED